MRDWTAIQERYLKDALPTRLGGLAANLGRIKAFAGGGTSDEVVESLMEESKHFIEWIAAEAEVDIGAQLVELQVELASWQRSWRQTRDDAALRKQLAAKAGTWSERVLGMSGLLG